MAYRVEIARRAEADLEELYLWVVERAPQQGARWFNGLERAVLSLDHHPRRCPVAPESIDPHHRVHVLYSGNLTVIGVFFTLDDDAEIVRVLHVRRGARQRPMAKDWAETKPHLLLRGSRMHVPLTVDLERFVNDSVESGRYDTADQVVREAQQVLETRDEARRRLQADVRVGFEQLARGESCAYDRATGRQLAERNKSGGRAARADPRGHGHRATLSWLLGPLKPLWIKGTLDVI
jgi:antitoxin ParD1/3/4